MLLSVSPRAINTPTLLEEYEADQKGYDQFADEDTVITLSREHDRVQGNEAFYKVLLNNLSTPTSVTGNEGFMSTLKAGANKAIEVVKSFFKWLFSFFGGKKEVASRKAETLGLDLDKHGVKKGEIKYPSNYTVIYNLDGKPHNNLGWMHKALSEVSQSIESVKKYVSHVERTTADIARGLSASETARVSVAIDSFYVGTADCFNITKPDTPTPLFGAVRIKLGTLGKLHEATLPRIVQGGVFQTDLPEVTKHLTQHNTVLTEANNMVKKSTELEGSLTKMLKSITDSTNKTDAEHLQTLVRTVMANIKLVETHVFKALTASASVLSASLDKG